MDTEKIKTIMKYFEESQIKKMDLQDGDIHLVLEKEVQGPIQTKEVTTLNTELKQEGTPIKSVLVGTYYQASSQNGEPFVQVGDYVHKGDTLCIIEAMKVMNEIKSDVEGTVQSILISDGETVEYDQVLMIIG